MRRHCGEGSGHRQPRRDDWEPGARLSRDGRHWLQRAHLARRPARSGGLLDFWGTFCEPCKKSFPKLEELNRKYAASGLRIIGISEDEEEDKDKIPEFARAYAANFPLAWDDGKSAARRYKPETMPSSFLIDKDGVVRFVHVGYHEGEETEIDGEVRGLLGMK